MKQNFSKAGILMALALAAGIINTGAGNAPKPMTLSKNQAGATATFRGYVRTALVAGGIPQGLGSCRVLLLNKDAPGLQVGHPISSVDTVLGPATLFADYSTASSGYYEINVPPGDYLVIFWAVGFVPVSYYVSLNPGINEPILAYYEKDERPIKPGTTINPWQGGPTHDLLEFDRSVVTAASTTTPETGLFTIIGKTYKDFDKNFEISAPGEEWTTKMGKEAQAEVANSRFFMQSRDSAAAVLAGTNLKNLDKEKVLELYTSALGKSEVIGKQEVTVGSLNGIRQTQIHTESDPPIFFFTTVLLHENNIYIIVCWTDVSLKDQKQSEFDRIVQSFKILKQ